MPANYSSHPLYGAIVSAASAQATPEAKSSAISTTISTYLHDNFGTLVDTPDERKNVEGAAVAAFNFLIGDKLGTPLEVSVDALLVSFIDRILVAIGTPTPPVPAPVVTPAVNPIGSAAP